MAGQSKICATAILILYLLYINLKNKVLKLRLNFFSILCTIKYLLLCLFNDLLIDKQNQVSTSIQERHHPDSNRKYSFDIYRKKLNINLNSINSLRSNNGMHLNFDSKLKQTHQTCLGVLDVQSHSNIIGLLLYIIL